MSPSTPSPPFHNVEVIEKKSSGLMSLATETRLSIISYVVSSPHQLYHNPPGLPSAALRPRLLQNFETNASSLLCVCKRLRVETKDVLDKRKVDYRHYELEYPIHMGDRKGGDRKSTGLFFDGEALSNPLNIFVVPPTRSFIPERTDAEIDVLDITLSLQTEIDEGKQLVAKCMKVLETLNRRCGPGSGFEEGKFPNPLSSIIECVMAKCSLKTDGIVTKQVNVHLELVTSPYVLCAAGEPSPLMKKTATASLKTVGRDDCKYALNAHFGYINIHTPNLTKERIRTTRRISVYVDGDFYLTVPRCANGHGLTYTGDQACDASCNYEGEPHSYRLVREFAAQPIPPPENPDKIVRRASI